MAPFGKLMLVGLDPIHSPANATRMRRFSLPFFSILVTATCPISPVVLTCVPPQGCRSTAPFSPMTTRRTLPVPIGGFTAMVRTRPGLASSSASVIQRSVTGMIGGDQRVEIGRQLVLVDGRSVLDVEIEPALVGTDLAPVTGNFTRAHSRCRQVCMRMSLARVSQSSTARTVCPG